MSEETKRIEQAAEASELSEQDLNNVAGGGVFSSSNSGIKTIAAAVGPVKPSRAVTQGGVGN